MAETLPTAANIISSLGIKGATVDGNLPGYVPVLGPDGMLSARLVPPDAAVERLPALSNVAFVDPYTTVAEGLRKGSVSAPFKTLQEVADRFEPTSAASSGGLVACVMAPGMYGDGYIQFPEGREPAGLYLIGIGDCRFASNVNSFGIHGLSAPAGTRPSVFIQNVRMGGAISVQAYNASVTAAGRSYVHRLDGLDGMTLALSPESRVDSTNASSVAYLADGYRIGNTSTVAGATVGDALDRLGGRRIRVANARATDSGLGEDSASPYADISAGSESGVDLFDLSGRDRLLAERINTLFKRTRNVVADTVYSKTVTAGAIYVDDLRMRSLTLGGYRLHVDSYGYLVVADGADVPPKPVETSLWLRDTVTGILYMIGVDDGRMYIADTAGTEDSSDSSSSMDVRDEFTVTDPATGASYSVTVADGRLTLTRRG